MTRRPNIIVTIADDQTHRTIGALNNPQVFTPNLDKLAERGTAYTRAQHGGSTHAAVCAPSRAQLHTGRKLFHTSDCLSATIAPDLRRAPDPTRPHRTLGQRLREAGYDTFGVGKWHNGQESFRRSFAGGSTVFFGGMCPHYCVMASELPSGTDQISPATMRTGHSTEIFTAAAVKFIESRSPADAPFFLYVSFTAPHDPRETHHRFRARYVPHPPLPPNFLPAHPFVLEEGIGRDEHLAEFPRSPDEVRMHRADYYAMITHLDEGIGRIHGALETTGLRDNTIVVHTADHGLSVGAHGLMGKQHLYDEAVRVPLLVSGPDFAAAKVDDRLCYMHDLYPTLLRHAGAADPASEFVDLQDDAAVRTHIHSAFGQKQAAIMRSVREERFKLIEYDVPAGRRTQLFDTSIDPDELHDLSADPSQTHVVARLRSALRKEMSQSDDPLRDLV